MVKTYMWSKSNPPGPKTKKARFLSLDAAATASNEHRIDGDDDTLDVDLGDQALERARAVPQEQEIELGLINIAMHNNHRSDSEDSETEKLITRGQQKKRKINKKSRRERVKDAAESLKIKMFKRDQYESAGVCGTRLKSFGAAVFGAVCMLMLLLVAVIVIGIDVQVRSGDNSTVTLRPTASPPALPPANSLHSGLPRIDLPTNPTTVDAKPPSAPPANPTTADTKPPPTPPPTAAPTDMSASNPLSPTLIPITIRAIQKTLQDMCDMWPRSDKKPKALEKVEMPCPLHVYWQSLDNGIGLKSKVRQAITRTKTFRIVLNGASPTAGADLSSGTYRWDHFIQQALTPILNGTFSVRVNVTNIGGQGTNSFPIVPCLGSIALAGGDVDMVTYDWQTFGETQCSINRHYRVVRSLPSSPLPVQIWGFQGPFPLAETWSNIWGMQRANKFLALVVATKTSMPSQRDQCPEPSSVYHCWSDFVKNKSAVRVYHTQALRKVQQSGLYVSGTQQTKQQFATVDSEKVAWYEFVASNKTDSWYKPKDIQQWLDDFHNDVFWHGNPKNEPTYDFENQYQTPKLPGLYQLNPKGLGVHYDYVWELVMSFVRQGHHPGELGHLFIAQTFTSAILQALIYVLQDILEDPTLAQPYTEPKFELPPPMPDCVFPYEEDLSRSGAQWCGTTLNPMDLAPDSDLRKASATKEGGTAEETGWVYNLGGHTWELDHKDFWGWKFKEWQKTVSPKPLTQPTGALVLDFQVKQLPAILLLCTQYWRANNLDWTEFSLDGTNQWKSLANKTLGDLPDADGRFNGTKVENHWRLQWRNMCVYAGEYTDEKSFAVGQHRLHLRVRVGTLGNSVKDIEISLGWIVVL